MPKNTSALEIARLFEAKLEEENIISSVFDYLSFDCTLRCYINFQELDKKIAHFYASKTVDSLIPVIELIQESKKAASVNDVALLNDIKSYIVANLSDDIDLTELASKFYISYHYLCHLFKKYTKRSFNHFRTVKKLEKAIRLLLESDEKIAEIAVACGFDNISYFSETFLKHIGETPSDFRKKYASRKMLSTYELDDMLLALKMENRSLLSPALQRCTDPKISYSHVHDPSESFGYFLHEAAIIEYEGVLYASWYNCKEKELIGYTPIVGRRSRDGGKTWSEPEIIAEDKSEQILYCPPVYGICDGKLYLLLNQMVAPDHIHSLDLYVLNKATDTFEKLWSRPIPFKLNTNVITLPSGKLLLPGRIGELDRFPNTPAVMISDSGKIDAEWRIVKVAENGDLPDGTQLVHPETTVICHKDVLYMFNRNDQRKVPLLYTSHDFGETWSEAMALDIPYVSSKIYAGTLSDGRAYLVANTDKYDRTRLVLYVSEKNELRFTKEIVLRDCADETDGMLKCHYPAACEKDGTLYIIATVYYDSETLVGRGAALFPIDLSKI